MHDKSSTAEQPHAQTPRTDAEAQWAEWNGEAFQCVHATFARELEQELREAVKWRGVMTEIADKAQARAEAAESALEEANGKYRACMDRLNPSIEYVEAIPVGYGEDEIDRLNARLDALQSRLDAAERDAARMDWLVKMKATVYAAFEVGETMVQHWVTVDERGKERHGCVAETLRESIDKAIAEQPNLIDAFNGRAPFPDIAALSASAESENKGGVK